MIGGIYFGQAYFGEGYPVTYPTGAPATPRTRTAGTTGRTRTSGKTNRTQAKP